jgi:hypothetical protein
MVTGLIRPPRLVTAYAIGSSVHDDLSPRILHCIDMSEPVYCLAIGAEMEAAITPTSSNSETDPDCAALHPGFDGYARNPGASCPVRATYSV